ncbi:MAG: hypothetical protein AAFV80_22915, partial [Bacteroidota bacterium]
RPFYIGVAAFLFVVGGYYTLREFMGPGYLEAVWKNEFVRYGTTTENHKADFWHYYNRFQMPQVYRYWLPFVPVGFVLGYFLKDERSQRFYQLIGVTGFLFFLVLSSSSTKLEWYDLPLYPIMAFMVAIVLDQLRSILSQLKLETLRFPKIVPYLAVLFFFFFLPYGKILEKTHFMHDHPFQAEDHRIGKYLQMGLQGKVDLDGQFIAHRGYHSNIQFYMLCMWSKGVDVTSLDWRILKPGYEIIAHQWDTKAYIEEFYSYELLGQMENIKIYRIIDRIKPEPPDWKPPL